jgi:hypothetical protein
MEGDGGAERAIVGADPRRPSAIGDGDSGEEGGADRHGEEGTRRLRSNLLLLEINALLHSSAIGDAQAWRCADCPQPSAIGDGRSRGGRADPPHPPPHRRCHAKKRNHDDSARILANLPLLENGRSRGGRSWKVPVWRTEAEFPWSSSAGGGLERQGLRNQRGWGVESAGVDGGIRISFPAANFLSSSRAGDGLERRGWRDQRDGGAESAGVRGSGLQAEPCTKKVCTSTLWSYIVVEIRGGVREQVLFLCESIPSHGVSTLAGKSNLS